MELTDNHPLIMKLEYAQLYLHFLCILHGVGQPIFTPVISSGATRWCSWLRHCATSWKVTGSIPDVIGIFH